MILILSEEKDVTTDYVCNWFNHYNAEYIRLNKEVDIDIINDIMINNDKTEIIFKKGNQIISTNNIDIIWFRRGQIILTLSSFEILKDFDNYIISKIKSNIIEQNSILQNFIYSFLKQKKSINNPIFYNINKLYVLQKAKEIGLEIPDSLITKNKNILNEFINTNQNIITKNIYEQMILQFDNTVVGQKTEEIKIAEIKENFNYSLFQKNIKKKFELRIFYFLGKFYSAAIFSQRDLETKIDFRVADFNPCNKKNSPRIVPYKLNRIIKIKLDKLMKILDMESGSIDILVTKDNKFIFLEVNPVGQIDFVSKLCNYNIEKEIAEQIISWKN